MDLSSLGVELTFWTPLSPVWNQVVTYLPSEGSQLVVIRTTTIMIQNDILFYSPLYSPNPPLNASQTISFTYLKHISNFSFQCIEQMQNPWHNFQGSTCLCLFSGPWIPVFLRLCLSLINLYVSRTHIGFFSTEPFVDLTLNQTSPSVGPLLPHILIALITMFMNLCN